MKEMNLDNDFLEYPVAMSYVPWQHFDKIYDDLEKAFKLGTIFPELSKPFHGRRCGA